MLRRRVWWLGEIFLDRRKDAARTRIERASMSFVLLTDSKQEVVPKHYNPLDLQWMKVVQSEV